MLLMTKKADRISFIKVAYNVIKERKGKTINGIFVKD
jgi:hypothetical protein